MWLWEGNPWIWLQWLEDGTWGKWRHEIFHWRSTVLGRSFVDFKVDWVSRDANSVLITHNCACMMSATDRSHFWLKAIPEWMLGLATNDCTPVLIKWKAVILKKRLKLLLCITLVYFKKSLRMSEEDCAVYLDFLLTSGVFVRCHVQ